MYSEKMNRFLAVLFTSIFSIFYLYVLTHFDGTGDDGDSISHYLYARWSWEMKYIWLNHWGKPVFTFLASPFAQFGFKGIQFFNICLGILAAFLTHLVAKKLEFKYSAFVIPIILLMPEYMKTCFSGLTEMLFAFLFILSIYLILKEKFIPAYTIISFLPFCRPDGNLLLLLTIILSVFQPKLRKYTLFLFTGHILLTIIGALCFNEDYLWLFLKNPNTYHVSYSIVGGWMSFVVGLRPFLSLPIYIFLWLGVLSISYRFYYNSEKLSLEFFLYFFALFIFIVHTILFKFGLFRSIGLLRYLIPISPIFGLICLHGLIIIVRGLERIKIKPLISSSILVVSLALYSFSSAKYGANYPSIFDLTPTQKLSKTVFQFIQKEFTDSTLMYYSYPYFTILRDINPYNWNLERKLDNDRIKEDIPKGSILIWDNWYCIEDYGITPDKIEAIPNIKRIKEFAIIDGKTSRSFILYEKE